MQLKEDVDALNKSMSETKKELNSFKNEFEGVRVALDSVKKNHEEFFTNFSGDLELMKDSRKELNDAIYDFKVLKNKLQNQVIEKFEEELKKELSLNVEVLRNDFKSYEELKLKLSSLLDEVKSVSSEVSKFKEISSEIKKGDFELAKHAQNLRKADQEKLELMRKIDTLEKLISKMRRNQR